MSKTTSKNQPRLGKVLMGAGLALFLSVCATAKAATPGAPSATPAVARAAADIPEFTNWPKGQSPLEVGKKADICIIDMNKPHLTPMYSEYSHLAYTVIGSDVETVLINGKVVMRNRCLTTIDEKEAMMKVRDIAVRIKDSIKS